MTKRELAIIKQELFEGIKRKTDINIVIKLLETNCINQITYYVEINLYIGKIHEDSWITGSFAEHDKPDAMEHSKYILDTVKEWFEHNKGVTVNDIIEIHRD